MVPSKPSRCHFLWKCCQFTFRFQGTLCQHNFFPNTPFSAESFYMQGSFPGCPWLDCELRENARLFKAVTPTSPPQNQTQKLADMHRYCHHFKGAANISIIFMLCRKCVPSCHWFASECMPRQNVEVMNLKIIKRCYNVWHKVGLNTWVSQWSKVKCTATMINQESPEKNYLIGTKKLVWCFPQKVAFPQRHVILV